MSLDDNTSKIADILAKANALQASNARLSTVQAFAMRQYTRAMYTARTAASAFGISLAGLRSLIVTTGWGALLVALGYLVDKLWLTKTTAEKASEAIAGIVSETSQRQTESVRNFETLAKKATEATEGSLEQREALEELQRTYKDLFPQELLEGPLPLLSSSPHFASPLDAHKDSSLMLRSPVSPC